MSRNLADRGAVQALLRRWLGCIAMFGLLTHVTAGAAVLAEPDASAVRNVIESQLEAFAADDSERAYAHASTGIRDRFGDAATFMAMVRAGYPMLTRPAAVSFFRAQTRDESDVPSPAAQRAMQVLQVVQVRDREGRLWRATYLLERQADVGWRISGCVVAADSETSGRST